MRSLTTPHAPEGIGTVDFESVFEGASDVMVLVDDRRRIVRMNASARRLFGDVSPGRMACGAVFKCRDLDGRRLQAQNACFGRQCLLGGVNLASVNMSVTTRSGERVPMTASYSIRRGGGGDGLLITLRDLRPYLAWADQRLAEIRRAVELEARRGLARDLHDGLAQTLAAARITAKLLKDRMAASELGEARSVTTALAAYVNQAWMEARAVLDGLLPERGSSLERALDAVVRAAAPAAEAKIRLQVAEDVPTLDPETVAEMAQIVREALSNALRHARATEVTVMVRRFRTRAVVAVVDDGQGFHVEDARPDRHFGLLFMRERARGIRARLTVTSAPGTGTRVRLSVEPKVKDPARF